MLKKRNNVVFSIDDIDLDDIEFNNATFFSDDMDISTIYLTNINLNDDDFNEDVILKILFLLDLWLGVTDISNVNHFKKGKQKLMPAAWYPTVWD